MRYLALILMLALEAASTTFAQQSSASGQATVEGAVVNAINSRQIPRAGVLLRNVQQSNNFVWLRVVIQLVTILQRERVNVDDGRLFAGQLDCLL